MRFRSATLLDKFPAWSRVFMTAPCGHNTHLVGDSNLRCVTRHILALYLQAHGQCREGRSTRYCARRLSGGYSSGYPREQRLSAAFLLKERRNSHQKTSSYEILASVYLEMLDRFDTPYYNLLTQCQSCPVNTVTALYLQYRHGHITPVRK